MATPSRMSWRRRMTSVTRDDNLRKCDLPSVNRRKLLDATNLHQTGQFGIESCYVSLLKERGLFDCCSHGYRSSLLCVRTGVCLASPSLNMALLISRTKE